MNKNIAVHNWLQPWPIKALKKRLQEGQDLHLLVRSRHATRGHDVRENILEDITRDVMIRQFGEDRVTMRKQIGATLRLQSRPFPSRSRPDLVVLCNSFFHICELKSSRTDYGRFDYVIDSRPFQQHLKSCGHTGGDPWEVEQDLIKLHLYKSLSPRVGSCLFLMVDAYEGSGHSWTRVFEKKQSFLETMRTDLVKGWADRLLDATRIEPLVTQSASARLITCTVHSWKP
jgi:hypothetical protein